MWPPCGPLKARILDREGVALDFEVVRAKYASGVVVDDQTLARYDSFLSTVRPGWSLQKLVQSLLQHKNVVRVLDVGCGSGRALHELKTFFGSALVTLGIDAVAWPARAALDSFTEGDVHQIILPSNIDLLVSFRSVHEMASLPTLIPRLVQCLSVGGLAILSIRLHTLSPAGVISEGALTPADDNCLQLLVDHPNALAGAHVQLVPVFLSGTTGSRVADWAGVTVLIERLA